MGILMGILLEKLAIENLGCPSDIDRRDWHPLRMASVKEGDTDAADLKCDTARRR